LVDNNNRLVEGIKQGDKSIFEEVYREFYIPLCYYCLKYVESFEDSEEIVQDLFVKLWDKREELEIKTSLKAYLYRSVQNYALNDLSKKKTKDKYLSIQGRQLYGNYDREHLKLEEDELRTILKHAILQLPEKRRRIFELSRFDRMKYGKIADHLSISVKTVEGQMTKALKYLRVVLKDYIPLLLIFIVQRFLL
jgi:RNA polymerase sigma-70 factor (ECF subfamily)